MTREELLEEARARLKQAVKKNWGEYGWLGVLSLEDLPSDATQKSISYLERDLELAEAHVRLLKETLALVKKAHALEERP